MRKKILPPGRFFKPYSVYEDEETLGCYYTRIFRFKDGKKEYPLSVSLGSGYLSIFWHGYQKRVNTFNNHKNEDYGVHQVFSFNFSEHNKESFEKWLSRKKLIPPEFYGGKNDIETYTIEEHDDMRALTYSEVFLNNPTIIDNQETQSFKEFFLDLLYDLKHSNVFINHPYYNILTGFLKSVPLSNAIWMKAEYLFNREENARLGQNPSRQDAPKIDFFSNKQEEAGKDWLKFLRTRDGEFSTDSNTNWFEGVEKEHKNVYRYSAAEYLRQEAEDSVQWLLERYDLLRAYRLQFSRIFSRPSQVSLGLAAVLTIVFLSDSLHAIINQAYDVHGFFGGMLTVSLVLLLFLWALFIERILYLGLAFIRSLINFFIKKNTKYLILPSRDFFDALLSLPKIINTIKPRILLASGAVWTFLFASDIDFLWSFDFKLSSLKFIILGILIFGSFMFMMAKFNTKISHHSNESQINNLAIEKRIAYIFKSRFWELTRRGGLVFLLASAYSFAIGLFGMSITGPKKLAKEGDLKGYFETFKKISPEWMQNQQNHCTYLRKEGADYLSELRKISDKETDKSADKKDTTIDNQMSVDDVGFEYINSVVPFLFRDTLSRSQVCFSHQISMNPEEDTNVSFRFFAVVEPLIFFTFVAVAVGILLEMGLRIEDTGIEFN